MAGIYQLEKAATKAAGKAAAKSKTSPYTLKKDEPKPARGPTKKERELQAKEEQKQRTVETLGLQPGANFQPSINPSEAELAAIRAKHGESGIERRPGDLLESAAGKPGYVDPNVGDILPATAPRTREQKLLQRRVAPATPRPEITEMIANPAVKARIMEAAKAGENVANWYDTTPLQQVFLKEFGPEEGQQRFEEFIGMVAGTSTGSDIGRNIKIGSNYFAQKYGGGRDAAANPYLRKGKDANPSSHYELPPEGYGAHMQQTHMHNVNNYAKGGGLSAEDNPKIAAFYENLLGNWMPTTIDKHAVRLGAMASRDPRFLTPQGQEAMTQMSGAGLDQEAIMNSLLDRPTNWQDVVATDQYPVIENYWNEIAKEMGIDPAQLQAQAWVGGGQQTGLGSPGVTFMDAFKDRIRRTSIRDNIPPEQVLKLMMHGKLTLAELEQQEEMPGGSMIG